MRHVVRVPAMLAALTLVASAAVPLSPAHADVQRYEIDTTHSGVGFKVRHFFTKTPGSFADFSGVIVWNTDDPTKSSVEATIDAASVDTDNDRRDGHLRSPDFFHAEEFPAITFKSKSVEAMRKENMYKVTGDLTIRDVTRPLVLTVEHLGQGPDGRGGTRSGFAATGEIDRTEFGLVWNKALDTGGFMLGNTVEITLDIEAALSQPEEG